MGLFDIFAGKRKREEALAAEKVKQEAFERQQQEVAAKGVRLEQGNLKVADSSVQLTELHKENTEIGKSLDAKVGQVVGLVQRYDDKEQQLLQREKDVLRQERRLREQLTDFEERVKTLRQKELVAATRDADIRRKESEVSDRDNALEKERKDIKEREADAKKLANDARTSEEEVKSERDKIQSDKKAMEEMKIALDGREETVRVSEEVLRGKTQEFEEREKALAAREDAVRESQGRLEEKIAEYDGMIKKIEVYKNTVDGMEFDASEEGASAKITVQEAIRKSIKMLEEQAGEFEALKEKYCEGTFKGFSVPVDEIDEKMNELRAHAEQIVKHAQDAPFMQPIVEEISSHLLDADKFRKSYDFAECYEHICRGLAASKCYEILLAIINELAGGGTQQEESAGETAEEDYYEILGVDENATDKEIKRAAVKALRRWHPDKNPEALKDDELKRVCEKKTRAIIKAKETLLDKAKREEYDARRRRAKKAAE